MSLSQDHNNLFRRSSASDKLSLLQSLLDSKDLTPVQAIALLNNIRAELETPQTNRSSVYRRYAQVMESLRREMPEVHEEVVHAWESKKANLQSQAKPAENLMGSQTTVGQESTLENPFESPGGYRQPLEGPAKHVHAKGTSAAGFEEHFEEGEAEHEELEEEHEEREPEEQLENEQEESKVETEEIEENEDIEGEKADFELGEDTKPEAEDSSQKGETEAEAGAKPEGGDRMATEAVEAAEQMEVEPKEIEVPGEEEPPMEAEK